MEGAPFRCCLGNDESVCGLGRGAEGNGSGRNSLAFGLLHIYAQKQTHGAHRGHIRESCFAKTPLTFAAVQRCRQPTESPPVGWDAPGQAKETVFGFHNLSVGQYQPNVTK